MGHNSKQPLIQFKTDDFVVHPVYGVGHIVQIVPPQLRYLLRDQAHVSGFIAPTPVRVRRQKRRVCFYQ